MPDASPLGGTLHAYFATLAANLERAERRDIPSDDLPQQVSPAEIRLLEALHRLDLYPKQQYAIGRFDADFYFPDAHLCVEVDGRQHSQTRARDRDRDRLLQRKGIYTMRIEARHVFLDPDACARAVLYALDRVEILRMKDVDR